MLIDERKTLAVIIVVYLNELLKRRSSDGYSSSSIIEEFLIKGWLSILCAMLKPLRIIWKN